MKQFIIDDMQASKIVPKCRPNVPPVPSFHATQDFDFGNVGGGMSGSFEDVGQSPEEMYSDEKSPNCDARDSSGSNYESTSSFEAL